MDERDWVISLRHQIEKLARRNENISDCQSASSRIKDMEKRIVQLRELVTNNPMEGAKYYVECTRVMDEIEQIAAKNNEESMKRAETFGTVESEKNGSKDDNIASESLQTTVKFSWWRILCLNGANEAFKANDDGVRNLWKTQIEFFLSCLGFIVGVGNTLRFPAKVYQHGGGVFFIPYILCMICFGLPIVYMHLCIGQFSGLSASGAFYKMMPIASGLGWALVLLAVPVCIYYNIIVAWAIYYFWFSFKGFLNGVGLPWDKCEPSWVTNYNCCDLHALNECFNGSTSNAITAPEAYFHFEVLYRPANGDFSLGPIQAHLVLALAVAWILIFFAVFKGIGSIGWTVSVTATVPYLLLTILFLRGTSLPGAEKGLRFLFTPNLDKLWSLPMWKSAAEQVFYELGIDAGPLIAMASFSRYRNNIYRDAVLLVLIDAISSVLCGMVIFSFIGFIAQSAGTEVNDVLQHDALYLAFTVYPGVTSFMHLGPLWAALFFAMLALSALDAEFAWLEMIASSIMYQLGSKNKRVENRILAFMCLIFFICGLPLCARGGIYIFHAIESLNANWNSFSLGLMQMILVCYAYGVDKFLLDISGMLRVRMPEAVEKLSFRNKVLYFLGPIGPYIKWAWSLFCPAILTALLVASMLSYERLVFENNLMPWGYELVAWLAMVAPLSVIPISAIHCVVTTLKAGKPLSSLFSTENWSSKNTPPEVQINVVFPPKRGRSVANGYTYIDPESRGPSTKSRVVAEEDYNKRTGRIAHFLQNAELMNGEILTGRRSTYGEGTYGDGTFTVGPKQRIKNDICLQEMKTNSYPVSGRVGDKGAGPLAEQRAPSSLFGCPPVSSWPPSAASSVDMRTRQNRSNDQIGLRITSPVNQRRSPLYLDYGTNEICPSPPASRPPSVAPDLSNSNTFVNKPGFARITRKSEESDEESEYAARIERVSSETYLPSRPTPDRIAFTDEERARRPSASSDSTSSSSRPQRPTVIRRYTSSDSLSLAAQSTGSISITPLDQAHHRSMSSIAIFDGERSKEKQPKLSQLKRPKPVEAPRSLPPSPATSAFP